MYSMHKIVRWFNTFFQQFSLKNSAKHMSYSLLVYPVIEAIIDANLTQKLLRRRICNLDYIGLGIFRICSNIAAKIYSRFD